MQDAMVSAIRASDLVVFVFGTYDLTFAYQLGVSDALGRPVLIVAEPHLSLPIALQRYMHVRADLGNADLLGATIRRFVDEVRKGVRLRPRKQASAKHAGPPGGPHDAWHQIRVARTTATEIEVHDLVKQLLETAGGFVESHRTASDRGVDFALWSDSSDSVLPHPILIEVKAGRLTEGELVDAETRLGAAVERSGASSGLLLYLDRAGRDLGHTPVSRSAVSRIELEEFARELATASLTTVLRRRRPGDTGLMNG